jgi:Uma2 family endonuclease
MAVELQHPSSPTKIWPPEPMTYEQFLVATDEDTHAEWVNGRIVLMSPVSLDHARLSVLLLNIVSYYVGLHRLGEVCHDPFQMKTGPDLPGRAPDIIFVANENLGRLKRHFLEGPADLVVEIISPESRGRDRGEKFYEYEEGGVKEYWLVDEPRKKADFYRLGGDSRYQSMEVRPNGRFESVVLPGFWLQIGWLWENPLPTLPDIIERWKAEQE